MSPERYRQITVLALVALTAIVVTGAAVRLTGSGLGCSDWPTCEDNQFVADLEFHPLVEFVNRLFTGVVSIAVILAVLGSLRRVPRRTDLTRWSLGLVAGVIAQIALGAATVRLELTPPIVMAHFLVSMVLIWNAVVLMERASTERVPPRRSETHGSPIGLAKRGCTLLAAVALFTGTVVTGAGPHGGDEDVERLDLTLQSVARVHSATVIALIALTIGVGWLAHRVGDEPTVRRNRWALVAMLVQGAIGYSQYLAGVPPLLVGLHVLGATLVWILVIRQGLTPDVEKAPPQRVESGATT